MLEKIKKFLLGRGIGYYLTVPAIAFCIAAICLYAKNGVTSFNPELNAGAIVFCGIGIGALAVSLVFDYKPIRYCGYLVILYAFMCFIHSQVTYIANVFVAIDGYGFTSGFIATAVMYVLAFAFSLFAGIFDYATPWKKNGNGNGNNGKSNDGDKSKSESVDEVVVVETANASAESVEA